MQQIDYTIFDTKRLKIGLVRIPSMVLEARRITKVTKEISLLVMENYPLIWYTALVKILTRLNILICPPPSKQKTKYKAIVMLISRPRFVF